MRYGFPGVRKGFTLVELLVVVSIIGFLVALLLPSLSAARQSAIAAGTNLNLNAMGRAFLINADQDDVERGRLSSGAFDHLRDGDVRAVGWVADVINLKVTNPNKSGDGLNKSKLSEKLLDYTGAKNSTGKTNGSAWSTGRGVAVYFGATTGPADLAGATAAVKKVELWDKGFNSNFCTTWHFSRGDQLFTGTSSGANDSLTNNAVAAVGSFADEAKCPGDGEGPLNEGKLLTCLANREQIALMANSRNGEAGDALVDATQATTVNNFFGFTGAQKIIEANGLTVESFTDGKQCGVFTSTVLNALEMPAGSGANATMNYNSPDTAHDAALHEMNDFYPVVGARKQGDLWVGGTAQVLFADGHVAKIKDEGGYRGQRDGWIGANKIDAASTDSNAFYEMTDGGFAEINGKIWVKDLGTSAGPGAGGGPAAGE